MARQCVNGEIAAHVRIGRGSSTLTLVIGNHVRLVTHQMLRGSERNVDG